MSYPNPAPNVGSSGNWNARFFSNFKDDQNRQWRVELIDHDDDGLWAWEILWSGTKADKNNRYFPYTEIGLLNMIRAGTFEYIACQEK